MTVPIVAPGGNSRTRLTLPLQVTGDTGNMSAATASNAAAVVNLAADTNGLRHSISVIFWSYSAAPTAGRLTIATAAGNYLDLDITAAGPGFIPFEPPLTLDAGSAATITLAAAGAVTGKVGCVPWRLQ